MASTTTNIGLTKPAGTDQALISAINGNMDIIDTKMGAVGNTSVQSQITSLSDQIATLNYNIDQKMTNSVVGQSIKLQCSNAIEGRQYYALLLGANDIIFVTMHSTNYNALSIKTGDTKTVNYSNNAITVFGLDYARYYLFDPLQVVESMTVIT